MTVNWFYFSMIIYDDQVFEVPLWFTSRQFYYVSAICFHPPPSLPPSSFIEIRGRLRLKFSVLFTFAKQDRPLSRKASAVCRVRRLYRLYFVDGDMTSRPSLYKADPALCSRGQSPPFVFAACLFWKRDVAFLYSFSVLFLFESFSCAGLFFFVSVHLFI